VDTRLRGYDKTYDVFPAKAGNQKKVDMLREGEWIPAYAGMTKHTMSFPRKRETKKGDMI